MIAIFRDKCLGEDIPVLGSHGVSVVSPSVVQVVVAG